MSLANIEISDDGWISGKTRPQNKQLCLVILDDDNLVDLRICQYRNGFVFDWDCGVMNPWSEVDRWKPLDLPENLNDRILEQIEKQFEEGEE